MNSLLDLYQTVLVPILSEWVNDRAVCSLDTAVCNRALRPHFLQVLCRCTIIHLSVSSDYEKRCGWMIARSLKLSNFIFGKSDDLEPLANLRRLFGQSHRISSVSVSCCSQFSQLIENRELQVPSLTFLSVGDTNMLQPILKSLKNLIILDVFVFQLVSIKFCSIIASCCPHLKEISARYLQSVIPLLDNCEDIQCLKYCLGYEIFEHRGDYVGFLCELKRTTSCSNESTIMVKQKTFSLSGLLVDDPISDFELCILAHYLASLESVDIQYCLLVTPLLKMLAERSTSLCSIAISSAIIEADIWEALMQALGATLVKIAVLSCHINVQSGLESIVRHCRKLEHLAFSSTMGTVEEEHLRVVLEHCSLQG